MGTLFKKLATAVSHFFLKRPKFTSLGYLNLAQFLGVVNDNTFKLVLVFSLIDIQGAAHAGTILSTVGAIFVLPFLLFSSPAGIMADRFSKKRVIVLMKTVETILMSLAIVAFSLKSGSLGYILLFGLSVHSEVLGPSKYGIIPELVPVDKVSKANGLVTSFSYFAMILGTFLASFFTEITNRNYPLIATFCLGIAFIGLLSSLFIQHTPAQGSKKQINLFFIKEIYETLIYCKTRRHLVTAICGSAYFLFAASFLQLNIIPFTLEFLHRDEVFGGYLFLATALGIALGSYLAGKASKARIELGMSCLAGIGYALFLFLLALFASSLINVILSLFLIGLVGGFFIVPFDSFIQLFSANERRGQAIATTNFLSFSGVLLSSVMLYVFTNVFKISPAEGFVVYGVLTLIVSITLFALLSDFSLPYFAKKIIRPLFGTKTVDLHLLNEARHKVHLIMPGGSWVDLFLLLSFAPNTYIFIPYSGSKTRRPLYSVYLVPHKNPMSHIKEIEENLAPSFPKGEDMIPCLFFKEEPSKAQLDALSSAHPLFVTTTSHGKRGKTLHFSKGYIENKS